MSRTFKPFTLVILFALLASCAVNPVTGKKEFSIVSAEQEVAIGSKNYHPSQQAQGGRYYIDPELQRYVAEVGRKLAVVSDRSQLPYDFVVLNNSVPNAWALPGGKIAINRGLLLHLDDESQLAAVLGHEIVHAAARHSAAQMTRGTFIGLGAQVLSIAGQNAGYGQLSSTVAQLGSAAWMARYGRGAELESDNYGMEYMARAGYDPSGAVELQKTFVKLSKGRQSDFISGLFASHPPSQARVAANQAKAKTLPKGNKYKARYQQKIAQLKLDKPAYDAEAKAIKSLQQKDPQAALHYLDKAIQIQPREGYFWELRGQAWKMQGNTVNAEKAFTTAIKKNPDFFSHYLARGLLRYEQGNKAGAKGDLDKSNQLLPTQAASYYLGEIAANNNQPDQAIQFYASAAQNNNTLGQQAQLKLARLELDKNPHKYLRSSLSLSQDGYLLVTIQNDSQMTVANVRYQIVEMKNAFIVRNRFEMKGPSRLGASKQYRIKTRLGPFEADGLRHYRVRVVSASVAE